MAARPLPPSLGGSRNTPADKTDEVVRATSAEAIPVDLTQHVPRGVPPEEGVPPERGILPGEGIMPGDGVLPGDGIMPENALLPGDPGQLDLGSPGQVDRGAPGQLDPGAENPWAPEEVGFDAATEEDALAGDVWPNDDEEQSHGEFFAAQPNFLDLPELEEAEAAALAGVAPEDEGDEPAPDEEG